MKRDESLAMTENYLTGSIYSRVKKIFIKFYYIVSFAPEIVFPKHLSEDVARNISNQNVSPNEFDTKQEYYQYLLSLHKQACYIIEFNSKRRINMNRFYMGLHAAIISGISYIVGNYPLNFHFWVLVFPLIALVTMCYTWLLSIKSFWQINGYMSRVIEKIEESMPLKMYTAFRSLLTGELLRKHYKSPMRLESLAPKVFLYLYFACYLYLVVYGR